MKQVGVEGVAVLEERAEEAERYEKDKDSDPENGKPVLRELAECEPPAALGRADLPSVRGDVERADRWGDVGH